MGRSSSVTAGLNRSSSKRAISFLAMSGLAAAAVTVFPYSAALAITPDFSTSPSAGPAGSTFTFHQITSCPPVPSGFLQDVQATVIFSTTPLVGYASDPALTDAAGNWPDLSITADTYGGTVQITPGDYTVGVHCTVVATLGGDPVSDAGTLNGSLTITPAVVTPVLSANGTCSNSGQVSVRSGGTGFEQGRVNAGVYLGSSTTPTVFSHPEVAADGTFTTTFPSFFHAPGVVKGTVRVTPVQQSFSPVFTPFSIGCPKYRTYAYVASSRSGGAVYINALIKRSSPGGIVNSPNRVVYIQRYFNRHWQSILSRVTNSAGRFTVGFIQTHVYQYRIYVIPTSTLLAATSASTFR